MHCGGLIRYMVLSIDCYLTGSRSTEEASVCARLIEVVKTPTPTKYTQHLAWGLIPVYLRECQPIAHSPHLCLLPDGQDHVASCLTLLLPQPPHYDKLLSTTMS